MRAAVKLIDPEIEGAPEARNSLPRLKTN